MKKLFLGILIISTSSIAAQIDKDINADFDRNGISLNPENTIRCIIEKEKIGNESISILTILLKQHQISDEAKIRMLSRIEERKIYLEENNASAAYKSCSLGIGSLISCATLFLFEFLSIKYNSMSGIKQLNTRGSIFLITGSVAGIAANMYLYRNWTNAYNKMKVNIPALDKISRLITSNSSGHTQIV